MDDKTNPQRQRSAPSTRMPAAARQPGSTAAYRRLCLLLLLVTLTASLSGCSLFVMAGKMFFGNPKIKPSFTSMTGIDLAKDEKTVLVICSTPEAIKSEMPSLNFDLLDGIVRRLKYHGISVIDPDKVATFIDDNGGQWYDASDFVDEFEADYIIHIDLEEFAFREENSSTMFRGRAIGAVYAYEVVEIGGQKQPYQSFVGDFRSEYPRHHPVSSEEMTKAVFQKRYLDFLSEEFGRKFYYYRLGDDF